jgi:hypothetical protein
MGAIAAKTGVAILIALAGLLQDGLRSLEQKDYPKAIAAFGKIAGTEEAPMDVRVQGQFWLAVAHGRAGHVAEAKQALATLFAMSDDADLQCRAFATLADGGVALAELMPKETPQAAFDRAKKALDDRDLPALRKCLGGELLATLESSRKVCEGQREDLPEQLRRAFRGAAFAEGRLLEGKDAGSGLVSFAVDDGQLVLTVRMVAVGDEWRFVELQAAGKREGGAVVPRAVAMRRVPAAPTAAAEVAVAVVPIAVQPVESVPAAAEDRAMLGVKRVLGALVAEAAANNGQYPQTLKEVVERLGQHGTDIEFQDPSTGDRIPLLYRAKAAADAKDPGTTYVLATPRALNGKRFVGFLDGHVDGVEEQTFLKAAKEQGWHEATGEPELSEKELKKKVDALVAQLGDRNFATRKTAYAELKKLGEQAEPMLKTHSNHPDPEVRISIRELLKRLEPASAAGGGNPARLIRGAIDWGGE